jgi:hypothetical protein
MAFSRDRFWACTIASIMLTTLTVYGQGAPASLVALLSQQVTNKAILRQLAGHASCSWGFNAMTLPTFAT